MIVQIEAVACKRIETSASEADYLKEVANLQILKQSHTSHHRIMLHLATIIHGRSFNILLPLAVHGDLELFLNSGISYANGGDGEVIYNPKIRFPNLTPGNLPTALFDEFLQLADGLRWLHHELRVGPDADLYGAHMDLKPSNVLVNSHRSHPVGKWMLSDFGISVFKASTGSQETPVVSIRDVHEQLTMKTRAKRGHGPYQAPEVQPKGEKSVGRRSDVWSLACIFCEVLAFALRGSEELNHFRTQRRNSGNDYFYSPLVSNDTLAVNPAVTEYQLRPSVCDWLDRLHTRYLQPQRWLECCVGTIKKILLVEGRPDAKETQRLLRHARDHLRESHADAAQTCPILNPESTSQVNPTLVRGDHRRPSVSFSPAPDDPQDSAASGASTHRSEANRATQSSTPKTTESPRPTRRPPPIPTALPASIDTQQTPIEKPLNSDESLVTHQRSSSLDSSIATGVMSRTILSDTTMQLPVPKGDILHVAVSSSGERVACLFKDCIYVYSIDAGTASRGDGIRLPLNLDKGWQMLALTGPYIVAWGWSSTKRKRLVSCLECECDRILTSVRSI